jgi:hypothetical protein
LSLYGCGNPYQKAEENGKGTVHWGDRGRVRMQVCAGRTGWEQRHPVASEGSGDPSERLTGVSAIGKACQKRCDPLMPFTHGAASDLRCGCVVGKRSELVLATKLMHRWVFGPVRPLASDEGTTSSMRSSTFCRIMTDKAHHPVPFTSKA